MLNTNWSIDPLKSEISFKVKHLMISNIKGVFNDYDATIETRDKNFSTAKIAFWINLSSLETGDNGRNEHLKSEEFFNFEKYKKITFVSDKFEKTLYDEVYNLWGYLTMKGITNRIKLNVKTDEIITNINTNKKNFFTINGKINRKDWDLNWKDASHTLSSMGSDEVHICCKLELKEII